MKRVSLVLLLLLAAFVAWYELAPRYTLNEMRKAAAAGNGAKLSTWVDYQALKIDLKGELRREILLDADRNGLAGDPWSRLGVEMAVALIPVGVDVVVTPEAVQAMFDARSPANTIGRGPGVRAENGVAVMPVGIPPTDIIIDRTGFSEFKVRVKGKDGAAIFRRHVFGWKLAGVDLPYRFGAPTP